MAKIATVSLSSLVYCSCCVCCLAATSGVAIKTAAAAVVCAILIMHAMRLFMAAQLLVLPFVVCSNRSSMLHIACCQYARLFACGDDDDDGDNGGDDVFVFECRCRCRL